MGKLINQEQINIKDAVGKEIKAVGTDGDRVAIAYTDNTYSIFEQYDDWGCTGIRDQFVSDKTFVEKLGKLADGSTYFTDFQKILIEIGVLDGDELVSMAKEHIQKYVEKENVRERKLYNKLHAKYGGAKDDSVKESI